jgi:uncharacterized protein (TIGR03435 family)
MNATRLSVAVLAAAASVFAQSKSGRPEFEVASVKLSGAQPENSAAVGIHMDGAQVRINYLTMKDYLRIAYNLRGLQINGPDWISTEHYDISAKLPQGTQGDQIREMLQTLLEERFQLKVHKETKEFPVYGLVVGKNGLKVQALPADPEMERRSAFDATAAGGPQGVSVNYGHGASFTLADNKFTIKKLTFEEFASTLSRFADRTVVDLTNTPGRFDFVVEMTPEDYRAMLIRSAINAGVTLPPQALQLIEGVSGESFFMSLEKVGLKVESRKAPLDVLVVDSGKKTPSEN